MKKNFIVFCVESGILQQQAKLLSASLVKHLSRNFNFIAISPRAGNYLDCVTEEFLVGHGVTVIKEDLNKKFEHYPIANKLIAMRFLEQQLCYKNLIFIDTDTVFINPIDDSLISSQDKLYLRPVDNKGPGSQGVDDPNDLFWQNVFSLFGLQAPQPAVQTTVGREWIRGYYNAGLVWSNGLSRFYQQWYDDFIEVVDSNLRPFGYQSRDGNDFRCLDQVALAVTASRYSKNVKLLPEKYNYPIPFKRKLDAELSQYRFNELIHIHYHKWFQHPDFLNHVCNDLDRNSEQYKWLNSKLPLEPIISGPFKS